MSKHKHNGVVDDRFIGFVALGYFLGNIRCIRAILANNIAQQPIPCKDVVCDSELLAHTLVPAMLYLHANISGILARGRHGKQRMI
jgi:hypothetical protein